MAVPKKKKTKSKRNKRRMHIFLKQPSFVNCPKCGKPVRPHTVCWNCGTYKNREVIDVLKKLTKKEKKQKEREIASKEAEAAPKGDARSDSETRREPRQGWEKKEKGKGPLSWEEMSRK